MRSFWKVLLAVMLVGLIGLFVAGCSQKQAAQPQPQQQLPKYTIASEIDYPPLEFVDTQTNTNTGFDIDLMNAIGKVEGFEPVFKNMGFDGIIAAVQTNNVDAAISSITITDERAKSVDFSIPYYKSGLIIAVRKDNNDIKSFADLKGKKLVAQIGTTGLDKSKEISDSVKQFDHVPEALQEIKNGAAVALINDLPVSAYYVNMYPNDYKLVGDPLTSEFYGIAIPKNRPEIKQKIDDGLNKLKASGEYVTIYKKWFGRDPESYLPGEPPK
ncbi:MAG: basic amino acid ABC transporter substrate-binding protein [Thermacetogeniaceae bacterium]